jgi:hypothetical protein
MAAEDQAAKPRDRMAKLRDKIAERSRPFLPTDSPVRQVVVGQTGPNPWLYFVTWLIFFWIRYRQVCVTDDGIYVLSCGLGGKPKELLATLPRDRQIGPVSGVWAKVSLDGESLWVHKRFHKEIAAADAARNQAS